jgi:DNA repair protein RadA/Sms
VRRVVFICYDSDVVTNTRVQAAEKRLATALVKTWKADVRTSRIPSADDGSKQGADDFLKAKGKMAFKRLLREALPANKTNLINNPVTLVVLSGSDVDMEPTEYLWEPYIPKAKLSGVKGDPGGGKTTLMMALAATFSRGCVPSSGEKCEPVNTLYFSHENDAESQVMPRFVAANGDPRRLFVVTGALDGDQKPWSFSLGDTGALEKAIIDHQIGLVIFDPLQSYLGVKVDMHRANETRPLLDGLMGVAKRTGAAIVIVRHLAKNSSGRSVNSGLGSIDIVGAVRSELLVGKSPDEPMHWAMIHDKTNVGRVGDSLRFIIDKASVKNKEGDTIETAKLEWRGKSDLTSADLRAPEGAKQKTVTDRAREWLRAVLTNGPRLAKELFSEWAAESGQLADTAERTMQKVSKELNITKHKGGDGKHGTMVWQLPPQKKFEVSRP